jgi:hypothetical protein
MTDNGKADIEANKKYRAAMDEARKPLDQVRAAVRSLFGWYDNRTDAVMTIVTEMDRERLNSCTKAARETHNRTTEELCARRDEALKKDPFSRYLYDVVRPEFEGHVDTLLDALPATMDQIKELADNEDWCTDFERMFSEAVKAGVVEVGTYERTQSINWRYVPAELNPQHNELWEVTLTLPDYIRPRKYDVDELVRYASKVEYRKLSD